MNYYLAHAGMVDKAFDLINKDIQSTDKPVYAYALDETVAGYDATLRQVVWSRNGLYCKDLIIMFGPLKKACKLQMLVSFMDTRHSHS